MTTTADHSRPRGTVTFLFTDIEGSTRLLQELGRGFEEHLETHRRLIRSAVEAEQGQEVNTEGDALFVVFDSAPRALAAAVAAQRALTAFPWPDGAAIRVRMGLHTGEAVPVGSDYVGLDVHRASRICGAGHGGQILLSYATKTLIEGSLPPGVAVRDLGEHRLKDLQRPERLFQVLAEGLPDRFPPLRSIDLAPNNLPTQVTSFVGRARELEEARQLLDRVRLLTLTGPGGTGKTRLSLQLAAETIDKFPDGVYFVPLAPIADPHLVPSTVAHTLGIQESGGRPVRERVLDFLRGKRILLILDNFEQVLAAAPDVGELLQATTAMKVVVTSRAPLNVYGEQEYPVPPLRLPDPKHLPGLESLSQYEAVALFIQRAVAVKHDFSVTNENAPAVAEITSRLDGLPLAIELAAARVKLLPPQAILSRMQRRLALPDGGSRDLPARQQTLRNAIAWSYDLLDEVHRRLMARLSVFVGGCTLEAAEAICGPSTELGTDVLDGLAGLINQSLLRREDAGGESRFTMLETIREFALERLEAGTEAEELRRRHASAFLAMAEQAEPNLTGPEQPVWLNRLEREHDNLRAAATWAIHRGEAEIGLRLGAALWRFWQMRGHLQEARERLAHMVDTPGAASFPAAHARALEALGGIAYWQGDMDGAQRAYAQNLDVWRALGDKPGIAGALYNLAFTYAVPQTDLDKARALLEESLALHQQLGNRMGVARVHWVMSDIAYHRNDYAEAMQHLDECLPVFREAGDNFSLAWGLHNLGMVHKRMGDYAAAGATLREALRLFAQAHDLSGIAVLLDDLSSVALAEGDRDRAARLAGGAEAIERSRGIDLATVINVREERSRPVPQDSGPQVAQAWEQGRSMSVDELVAYALAD
jgi:predicted ATPase/class 3 adenylate cyclase